MWHKLQPLVTDAIITRMRMTMNVSLPPDLKRWLDAQVRSGGYGTSSEYIRDILRRARQRQQRRAIDDMLIEAVEEGANIEMDEKDWSYIRQAARARVAKRRRKTS